MSDYFSLYVYFALIFFVTLLVLGASSLVPSKKTSKTKFKPYESGIEIETDLLEQRFTLHHYLVALMFLVFDIEAVFLYPWAVVGRQLGLFALCEITFFLAAIAVGFVYVWRKGGLQWE